MSQILENHFAILLDEATDENQVSKKKQKQLMRALNPTTVEVKPKKAEEKKAEKKTEKKEEKKPAAENKPAAAQKAAPKGNWGNLQAVSKPASHDAVAANGSSEKPQQPKLKIERPRREDMEVRPGKRQFERHSGTGRGKEQRKDGAGKANWGKVTDGKQALSHEVEAAAEAAAELKKDETTTPATEKKEGEEKKEEVAAEPAPKPELSFSEYMKQQKAKEAAPKFEAKATAAIEDEGDYSHMQELKEEEAVAKKAEKKEKKTEKKAEKAEKVDLQIKFNVDEVKQAQMEQERERFGGPRGGRGGRMGPRGGNRRDHPKTEKAAAPAAQAVPTAEAFPVLKKK